MRMTRLLLLSLLAVMACGVPLRAPAAALGATAPSLPRVVRVPSGGDLQAALDAAQPGDFIELPAGATFVGNFTLASRPGTGWVVVYSSAFWRLPPPGVLLQPAQATLMPKIISPNALPAIRTAAGAHHYMFVGIEVTTSSADGLNLIHLESPAQTSVDQVPTDIVFYRCYIHGSASGNIRRGIVLNGARLAVIGSYLSDFHDRDADSQAIAGWNGPGPFTIIGNYLEAAGENVMFGGADPTIPGLVPADIEVRGNRFAKPLSWKADEPDYAGIPWVVKNLFELKNARRVRVEGNSFEYSWFDQQPGFAILFTVRNQDGGAPWSVVEDVAFVNNVVRHTANGIHLLGWDNNYPSEQTKRILIQNNLFDDVGGPRWGGLGRLFQLIDGAADVVIDHNTAFQDGPVVFADGKPHAGFVYRNNLSSKGNYGVFGSGASEGLVTIRTYFPGAVFLKNVVVGATPSFYPPDNFFPTSMEKVGFVDLAGGNYRLGVSSPYKKAGTDGRDIGADIDALPLPRAISERH